MTSFDFSVDREMEPSQCIGSNSAEEIFTGSIRVTGNLSMYFEDGVVRSLFENESLVTLVLALATGSEERWCLSPSLSPKQSCLASLRLMVQWVLLLAPHSPLC